METGPDAGGHILRDAFVSVFAILVVFTAVFVAFSIPVGIYTVFFTQLSSKYDWNAASTPYLWIGPLAVFSPFQVSVGVAFSVLTAVYLGMFALALRQTLRPISALRESLRRGFAPFFSSPFLVIIIATAFTLFSAGVIDSIVSSAGLPVGNLMGDPLGLLLAFTAAPVAEEFGFRLVLIGLFAAVLAVGRPGVGALKALWRPSVVYEGGDASSRSKYLIFGLLGLSSLVFGVAHTQSGGWLAGKLFEATYGGLVLGYLYIRYGFHVAVLTHWGVDYFGSVYAFFGQGVSGVKWDSSPGYILQQIVNIDMLLLLGIASFLVVMYVGVRGLVKTKPSEGLKAG